LSRDANKMRMVGVCCGNSIDLSVAFETSAKTYFAACHLPSFRASNIFTKLPER